jgi:hypothetical protein
MAASLVCSGCGSRSVTEDEAEGLTYCEGCGLVVSASAFCSDVSLFDPQPTGLFVGANDDGTWAGNHCDSTGKQAERHSLGLFCIIVLDCT